MKNGLILDNNGNHFWYKDDLLHREDGPAIEYANGYYKKWYINGKMHREDGPAVYYSPAFYQWCYNDKLHRLDGPAVDFGKYHYVVVVGMKERFSWYFDGVLYDKDEHPFNAFKKSYNLSEIYNEWPTDMKMLLAVYTNNTNVMKLILSNLTNTA